ncbi:MAG: pilus assembly protein [Eubacterium sp.]|nr:pilus assembly protein [Eubacterium sp.]
MGFRDIKDKEQRKKGSITLEAAVFLVIFIAFYMAMIDLIQIARAQVILQYAANETAREISQYSYVLTKTGIVDKRVSTSTQAAAFEADAAKLIDDIEKVGSALSDGGDVIGAAWQAGQHAQDFFGDPDALMRNLFSLVKTAGANKLSEMVVEDVVKDVVEDQIAHMSSKGTDQYLKDLGIEDGMNGLDFSDSKWANSAEGGMPQLEVSIVYTIDFHLGIIELEPRTFKVRAKTALW